jgi:hypothetical protein
MWSSTSHLFLFALVRATLNHINIFQPKRFAGHIPMAQRAMTGIAYRDMVKGYDFSSLHLGRAAAPISLEDVDDNHASVPPPELRPHSLLRLRVTEDDLAELGTLCSLFCISD